MKTITMWAEKSSKVPDARSKKRPLDSTSKPTYGPESSAVRTVIPDNDIAKIRKEAEFAIFPGAILRL